MSPIESLPKDYEAELAKAKRREGEITYLDASDDFRRQVESAGTDLTESFKESLDPARKTGPDDIKAREAIAIQQRIEMLNQQLQIVELDIDLINKNYRSGTSTLEMLVKSQREKMRIEAELEQEKLKMSKL